MYGAEYHNAIDAPREPKFNVFQHFRKWTPGIRLLDYGCGRGDMVGQALQEKFEVSGVEFRDSLVTELSEKFKGACFWRLEEFWTAETGLFDIIYLNNVLEHTSDPVALIQRLKGKLSENGIMVVEGPLEANFTLAQWIRDTVFGLRKGMRRTPLQHPPYHLFFSQRRNQQELFARNGLNALEFCLAEQAWPFPAQWKEAHGIKQKGCFLLALASIFVSKLSPRFGNYFLYIGQPRELAAK